MNKWQLAARSRLCTAAAMVLFDWLSEQPNRTASWGDVLVFIKESEPKETRQDCWEEMVTFAVDTDHRFKLSKCSCGAHIQVSLTGKPWSEPET
jgi:hypothetical protein